MAKSDCFQRILRAAAVLLMAASLLTLPFAVWGGSDRQLTSGPFSLSVHGGKVNDSGSLGVDGRMDYLTRNINLHLFGTFDWLDSGMGEGRISNSRYGGGFALSHTYARMANAFAGMSMIREMDKNFGHAYLGGKVKVTDYVLLSAAYGFGFGALKEIRSFGNSYLGAEAVDWLKVGGALVGGQGMKANVYYHLTDPAHQKISGVDGELSYALLDNLTMGANGSYDITERAGQEQNWRAGLFMTFAFGGQKGSPIEIALDKNNPIEYPQIVRKVVQRPIVPSQPQPPVTPLSITQSSANVAGCWIFAPPINFQAVGGVGPYTWSVSQGSQSNLTPSSDTQSASWVDSAQNFCSTDTNLVITVRDSRGTTATANFVVQPAV